MILVVGRRYVTRVGVPVLVVARYEAGTGTGYEFIGVVEGDHPFAMTYRADGQRLGDEPDRLDVVAEYGREPVRGWVNVYQSGRVGLVHKVKEQALAAAERSARYGDPTIVTVYVQEASE